MSEASEISRLTPAEGLDLQEQAKAGAPAVVRRFTLYAAWRAIRADRFIPHRHKARIFETVCRTVEVEVAPPDDPAVAPAPLVPDAPLAGADLG